MQTSAIPVQAPSDSFTRHLEPVPFLDFSRQFAVIGDELLEAMAQVLRSQRFILGPEVAAFELAARDACRAKFAVGCASGTDALWLALAACGIGDSAESARSQRQDVVVTSPFSFFASASAILRAGARPAFADIDPLTFNLSVGSTELALAQNGSAIKGILPVHLFGQCADWTGFERLRSQSPWLRLIEDAAQAFGAAWTLDGEATPAGALGDAAAFSFYPTKNLSAVGDAGLATCRDGDVERALKSLRAHGMTRRYFHDEVGWNSRLDTLQAAALMVKLRYLEGWNARRRELAARYRELFLASGVAVETSPAARKTVADGVVLPYTHPAARHVFHQYAIRAPRRDALREHLNALGVGAEIYYPLCLHQQDALEGLGYKTGDFPEAERAAAEVLALPMYPELRDDEQDTVVEAIRRFYS